MEVAERDRAGAGCFCSHAFCERCPARAAAPEGGVHNGAAAARKLVARRIALAFGPWKAVESFRDAVWVLWFFGFGGF